MPVSSTTAPPYQVFSVDDDVDDQSMLKRFFSRHLPNYRLLLLPGGHELFEQLNSSAQLPILILLDINMPIMNGFEVLQALKLNKQFRHIPVLILTTSKEQEDALRCYDLGANVVFRKPSRLEDMDRLIDALRLHWLETAVLPLPSAMRNY